MTSNTLYLPASLVEGKEPSGYLSIVIHYQTCSIHNKRQRHLRTAAVVASQRLKFLHDGRKEGTMKGQKTEGLCSLQEAGECMRVEVRSDVRWRKPHKQNQLSPIQPAPQFPADIAPVPSSMCQEGVRNEGVLNCGLTLSQWFQRPQRAMALLQPTLPPLHSELEAMRQTGPHIPTHAPAQTFCTHTSDSFFLSVTMTVESLLSSCPRLLLPFLCIFRSRVSLLLLLASYIFNHSPPLSIYIYTHTLRSNPLFN